MAISFPRRTYSLFSICPWKDGFVISIDCLGTMKMSTIWYVRISKRKIKGDDFEISKQKYHSWTFMGVFVLVFILKLSKNSE